MHKAFPLSVIEFLLVEEVPTASEESSHCQKKRDAIAKRIALLEVIEFGDSYEVPAGTTSNTTTNTTSDGTCKKKGRTVTLTTEGMQKRKNDIKARTTLLLSLPDEHQLRFNKYKTTQELWAAILKHSVSYMVNDEENYALVTDEEAPTEFALMANTSAESKTGLLEFKNDTVTYYSWPAPTVESSLNDAQNKNPPVYETEASPTVISPKSFIKFVKANDSPSNSMTDKAKIAKKPSIKKRVKKGTSRSQNNTHESFTPRTVVRRPFRPPVRPMRSNMNGARPNRTTFNKQAHSYANRPFQRTSTVRSQYRALWVPTVNRNFPPVNGKFSTGSRKFPTANRKFSIANRKFPTGSIKFSTSDMGKKGKVVKPSACWFWKPSQNLSNKGNISYLSDYEPFDGGYMSFGQGGCNITGKGTIKTGKLEFENVYFVKDLKIPRQHNMYSIDLNNIVPHKDLTCLVAKASADKCTKDAASQKVKKDVSSIRYIALPNWVHDALLESSSSKPQDDCSSDVPESSGNSNLTATLINPLADQLETLTVESPIPIVSSPIPTACFTNSLEPSSDARLISKRVANQEETPSLDNILTLTNRFEDIL
nr:hypothetical protein [Tanacetum cinerariifolium]